MSINKGEELLGHWVVKLMPGNAGCKFTGINGQTALSSVFFSRAAGSMLNSIAGFMLVMDGLVREKRDYYQDEACFFLCIDHLKEFIVCYGWVFHGDRFYEIRPIEHQDPVVLIINALDSIYGLIKTFDEVGLIPDFVLHALPPDAYPDIDEVRPWLAI